MVFSISQRTIKKIEIPQPIIHIIGLPGAGKSTLSKKLAKKFKLPIFYIGKYRSKFPETGVGEADAWINLFHEKYSGGNYY
ncbi:hypothetical protein HY745_02540 [Candidatus Desantisbacteria bacterium]|nr:hypothetical protein [Candidatus Desantisbacteria bacterium]